MKLLKWILPLFMLFYDSLACAQTMWCPKAYIGGFEAEYDKAEKVLQTATPDLSAMEAYITVKGDHLYIQSNYKPEGAAYPFKIATDEKFYDVKDWLKYLIDPQSASEANAAFNRSYKNTIVLNVDASVLSHPVYKNLDWGEAKNLRIVDGNEVMETKLLPNTNERAVKVHENTYVALESDRACEVAEQISQVKEFVEKLSEAKASIFTTSPNEEVQAAAKEVTIQGFLQSVASSGLTLVNFGCDPAGTAKDIVFDAFKEASESSSNESLGQVKIHVTDLPAEQTAASYVTPTVSDAVPDDASSTPPDNDSGSSTGLGKAWYFIIGIVVIVIVRAVVKEM